MNLIERQLRKNLEENGARVSPLMTNNLELLQEIPEDFAEIGNIHSLPSCKLGEKLALLLATMDYLRNGHGETEVVYLSYYDSENDVTNLFWFVKKGAGAYRVTQTFKDINKTLREMGKEPLFIKGDSTTL